MKKSFEYKIEQNSIFIQQLTLGLVSINIT